jgi:predicted dehydrogenase
MYNLGVHWIDLLSWILDDKVVEVCGQNVKVNKIYDIEDNSFAHMRFEKGTIAALDISYTVPDSFPYGRDLYISIRGTRGVIAWAPAYEGQSDELFVVSDEVSFEGSPKRNMKFELAPTPGYSGYMGKAYVQAFVDSIRNNTKPPITGEDGVAVLKVVEAIYKSAKEKRWVKVKK